MRFVKFVDFNERTYDSCLPEIGSMLDVNSVSSPYTFNGDNVPAFIEPNDDYWITEKSLSTSVIAQFPFKDNPTRRTTPLLGILSASDDVDGPGFNLASSPIGITGVDLEPLTDIFKVRNTTFSLAPYNSPYDITAPPYYMIESYEPIDLTSNLVSYYRPGFLTVNPTITALSNLVSNPGSNTDLIGLTGTTSGGPDRVQGSPVFPADSPYLGRGFIAYFDAASSAGAVELLVATGNATDHQMSSAGVDVSFSISVTFRLSDLVTVADQFLICRRRGVGPSAGAPDPNFEYSIHVDNLGAVYFRKGRSAPDVESYFEADTAKGLILEDTWHHVVVTYEPPDTDDGATIPLRYKIYVDGIIQGCTFAAGGSSASPTTTSIFSRLRIGTDINPLTGAGRLLSEGGFVSYSHPNPDPATEIRSGYIHSVAIWKGLALTSDQVSELYNLELVGSAVGSLRHRQGRNILGISRAPALRYGISNVNPEFSSVQILPFHFGHARDMLEQRKDTASVALKAPVSCKFISGSNLISANFTHAQNISTFATSSLPYFDDGIARNRSDNPDDNLTI